MTAFERQPYLLKRGLLQSEPPELGDDGPEEELLLQRRAPVGARDPSASESGVRPAHSATLT